MKNVIIAWLFVVSVITILVFLIWLAINIEFKDIRRWRYIRGARREEKKNADKR